MPRKPNKVLGVLGGMGPAATAEFLRLLAEMAGVDKDQDHPKVLLFSNPQIPDRTAAIVGGGEDPAPAIFEGLRRLESWGAELLAVPCNTAHVFIDKFRDDLHVPLVHIVEETVTSARKASPEGAWIIATSGTSYSEIYTREAHRQGYSLLQPSGEIQRQLQLIIGLVKSNRLKESGETMAKTVMELWNKKELPVVAACTELPLAFIASGLASTGMVSSLESLAGACLQMIYSSS